MYEWYVHRTFRRIVNGFHNLLACSNSPHRLSVQPLIEQRVQSCFLNSFYLHTHTHHSSESPCCFQTSSLIHQLQLTYRCTPLPCVFCIHTDTAEDIFTPHHYHLYNITTMSLVRCIYCTLTYYIHCYTYCTLTYCVHCYTILYIDVLYTLLHYPVH